jgi:hypothetical protein
MTDKGIAKVMRANFFRDSLSVIVDNVGELELTLNEWRDINPRSLGGGDAESGDEDSPRNLHQGAKSSGRQDDRRAGRPKDKGRERPPKPHHDSAPKEPTPAKPAQERPATREQAPKEQGVKAEEPALGKKDEAAAPPKPSGKIFMDAPRDLADGDEKDAPQLSGAGAHAAKSSEAQQPDKAEGPADRGKEGQGKRRRKRRSGKRR